jgi:hypothetical protein
LAQAASAPNYDTKKAQRCVQDGMPTTEPDHKGYSPYYWCCYVNWSGTFFLSETVRYNAQGQLVHGADPYCFTSPP